MSLSLGVTMKHDDKIEMWKVFWMQGQAHVVPSNWEFKGKISAVQIWLTLSWSLTFLTWFWMLYFGDLKKLKIMNDNHMATVPSLLSYIHGRHC